MLLLKYIAALLLPAHFHQKKAVVRIARQDSTATGTVYYKWDTAAEWTEVNQTAYNDTPREINRPDDSLDHTVHFKVVCGTDTIINHCQVNNKGAHTIL